MRSNRPNVLWLFADQLRHHALACNGDPNARTPALDRLAAEGVACDLAVSQCPVCMPFRAGLVTGQYGHVNGLRVHGDLLAPGCRTVAHAFRDAVYRTSYVGKLHLASTNSNWTTGDEFWIHPDLRAGFQDFFGFDLSLWIDRGLGLVTLGVRVRQRLSRLWIDRGLGLVTLLRHRFPPSPRLWIDRGLGLVTLPPKTNPSGFALWIDRGLGLVTLARRRYGNHCGCGLTAGWDWLHLTSLLYRLLYSCGLTAGWDWLHFPTGCPPGDTSCGLTAGWDWLHYPQGDQRGSIRCGLTAGWDWLH